MNDLIDNSDQELEKRKISYAARLERKKESLKFKALSARIASENLFTGATRSLSNIPLGQPVTSESDRKYRERIQNTINKSADLIEKAEYYERKLDGFGTGGVSSDDPEAIIKLKKQVDELEIRHEKMKACNKIIKNFNNKEDQVKEIIKLDFDENKAIELVNERYDIKPGFTESTLQNNRANINRIKKRIKSLEKIKDTSFKKEEYEKFVYIVDKEENRIFFIFKDKPDTEIINKLKNKSFKWSPLRNALTRKITSNALFSSSMLKLDLNSL